MYGKELLDRAKKRGRAYQCLACHFLKGERWVDEFGKLEDHILRHHMEPERVPFFCRLCKFKCMRHDQLVRHVSHYARHVTMAASRQIVDHTPWLVASSDPYRITEMDYRKFTQDESLNFFLEKQKQSPLSAVVNKMAAGTLERDISTETLNAGYISMPTGTDVQPSGSSACVTELSTAVMSASDQWAAYPLPINTKVQTPVRTIMPYTQPIAPQIPLGQAMTSTEVTGYLTQPRTVAPPVVTAQTGLCTSRVYPQVIPSASTDRVTSTFQMMNNTTALLPASQQNTPAAKISMGLDVSPAGDTRLIPTSEVSTPQPSSVEDGYVPEHPLPRCKPQLMSEGTIQLEKEESTTSVAALSSTDALPHTVQERSHTESSTEESTVIEDIRSQLLQPDEVQLDSHEESKPEERNKPTNTTGQKNKKVQDTERTTKRRKTDDDNAMIRISLVAINGLVSNLQSLESQTHRNEKIGEKFVQALTETNSSLNRVADALNKLQKTVEENGREERRREERRMDWERRMDEERRREQENRHRIEERKREEDRKDRHEIRQYLEAKREEDRLKKEIERKQNKENKDDSKVLKSICKRQYTENTIKDFDSYKRK